MKGRHFFEVGDTVQLMPRPILPGHNSFAGVQATIKRIELRPDPTVWDLSYEEWRCGPHWTIFWVEVDGFQYGEVPFRYRDLRPLQIASPR